MQKSTYLFTQKFGTIQLSGKSLLKLARVQGMHSFTETGGLSRGK